MLIVNKLVKLAFSSLVLSVRKFAIDYFEYLISIQFELDLL